MSISRIRELEQQLRSLKVDKEMSAGKANNEAVQPAVSVPSLEPALRAEIAQLREQIAQEHQQHQQHQQLAAKDSGREKEVSTLTRHLEEYRWDGRESIPATLKAIAEDFQSAKLKALADDLKSKCDRREINVPRAWAAAMQEMDGKTKSEAAPIKHEPPKEPTLRLSATDHDKYAKPLSPSPSLKFDLPGRPRTPLPGSTPTKFTQASTKPTASSQGDPAQALQKPREKPRSRMNLPKPASPAVSHVEFSTRKGTEQQAMFKAQRQ